MHYVYLDVLYDYLDVLYDYLDVLYDYIKCPVINIDEVK